MIDVWWEVTMHFSSKKIIVSLFFVSSVLSGCSFFFDKKEKETVVSFKSDHSDCMSKSGDVLKNYFEDFSDSQRAQDNSRELGLCYDNAIDAFVKFTVSGEDSKEEYGIEEFRNFFDKYYPEMGMSFSKIKGYIEFKHYFIGGSKETVTKSELLAVSQLLPELAGIMGDLAPYRSIFFGEEELSQDKEGKEKFYKAFSALKVSAGRLLQELKPWDGQRSADMSSLGSFVVNEYLRDDIALKLLQVKTLISFKNLILNERHEFLKREDLPETLVQSIKTFEAIAEFNYFVKDEEEDGFFTSLGDLASFIVKIPSQLSDGKKFQGEAFPSILHIIEVVEEVLSQSAKRNEQGIIHIDRVGDLMLSLGEAQYMTGPLTAPTLVYFIKNFSQRWLVTSKKDVGPHLDRNKIKYIRQVVSAWSERQKYINKLIPGDGEISLEDISDETRNNKNIQDWLSVYQKTALHQWMPDGRVKYSADTSELSYEELTVANSIYSLSAVFMKPYSLDKNGVLNYTVKKEEAQEVYNVLRILGLEMGFVDARVLTSGENNFREGNNFTTQGRSNEVLDFYEAFELMSVNFASGMMANRIHQDFKEDKSLPEGCLLDYKDVFLKKVMRADCFRKHLVKNFGKYFSQLESFNKYWENADDLEKAKFLGVVEMASRGGSISKKPFDLGELRIMSGTMHYLESVYYNFDKNRNGIATNEELFNAEEHFRPLVTEFIVENKKDTIGGLDGVFNFLPDWLDGGQTGEQQMKDWAPAIFMYILQRGQVPEGFWGSAGFFGSRNTFNEWAKTAQVDHNSVLRVFGALASTTGRGHKRKIRNFLLENKKALFDDIEGTEVPDCRAKENLPFCKWARLIYCNEPVNADLYDWMNKTQLSSFPDEDWEKNKEKTVDNAMLDMSRTFRGHKTFSTQCGFPEIEPEKDWLEWMSDGVDSALYGTPTDAGVVEQWNNFWSK